jgi:hypothetical protein
VAEDKFGFQGGKAANRTVGYFNKEALGLLFLVCVGEG